MPKLNSLCNVVVTALDLLLDALRFVRLSLRPRSALAAANLLLRKQLALYLERQVKPRRAKAATKLTLILLSRRFAWREALTVVKPETFIQWHRQGFRLFCGGDLNHEVDRAFLPISRGDCRNGQSQRDLGRWSASLLNFGETRDSSVASNDVQMRRVVRIRLHPQERAVKKLISPPSHTCLP
jgi:hypothetical protein